LRFDPLDGALDAAQSGPECGGKAEDPRKVQELHRFSGTFYEILDR
jgi:hypothetical protein